MSATAWQMRVKDGSVRRPDGELVPLDERSFMAPVAAAALTARGLIYCTRFEAGAVMFAGHIVASSFAQAEQVALYRALGEEVLGRHEMVDALRPG